VGHQISELPEIRKKIPPHYWVVENVRWQEIKYDFGVDKLLAGGKVIVFFPSDKGFAR